MCSSDRMATWTDCSEDQASVYSASHLAFTPSPLALFSKSYHSAGSQKRKPCSGQRGVLRPQSAESVPQQSPFAEWRQERGGSEEQKPAVICCKFPSPQTPLQPLTTYKP